MFEIDNALNIKQDVTRIKQKVCIYWLQDLCKKGDDCPFLHMLNKDKLPICKYFFENGECQKGDKCIYKHVRPENDQQYNNPSGFPYNNIEKCPYYERGFCYRGQDCK